MTNSSYLAENGGAPRTRVRKRTINATVVIVRDASTAVRPRSDLSPAVTSRQLSGDGLYTPQPRPERERARITTWCTARRGGGGGGGRFLKTSLTYSPYPFLRFLLRLRHRVLIPRPSRGATLLVARAPSGLCPPGKKYYERFIPPIRVCVSKSRPSPYRRYSARFV